MESIYKEKMLVCFLPISHEENNCLFQGMDEKECGGQGTITVASDLRPLENSIPQQRFQKVLKK